MKYLFVGDIHNHSYIFKDIERLNKEYNFNKIIFVGDYVDDWHTTNHESLETLNIIIDIKKIHGDRITLLLGNHELSYLGYPCSGHQYELEDLVTMKLKENIDCFDLYTTVECNNKKYYCSHAGFNNSFIINVLGTNYDNKLKELNSSILRNLDLFTMCSSLRGGRNEYSSSMWTDVREHIEDLHFNKPIIPNQIIGHSPVTEIYNVTNNCDYYFIDTHSTYSDGTPIGDKSYLIWNEDKFEIIK